MLQFVCGVIVAGVAVLAVPHFSAKPAKPVPKPVKIVKLGIKASTQTAIPPPRDYVYMMRQSDLDYEEFQRSLRKRR